MSNAFLRLLFQQGMNSSNLTQQQERRRESERIAEEKAVNKRKYKEFLAKQANSQFLQGKLLNFLAILPYEVCLLIYSFSSLSELVSLCKVSVLSRIISNEDYCWSFVAINRWREKQNRYSLFNHKQWRLIEQRQNMDKIQNNNNQNTADDEEKASNSTSRRNPPSALSIMMTQHLAAARNITNNTIQQHPLQNYPSAANATNNSEEKAAEDPNCIDEDLSKVSLEEDHSDSTVYPPHLGLKQLYVLAEMDALRCYITQEELCTMRWRFNFKTELLFGSSESFFPRFRRDWLFDAFHFDHQMSYRFIENNRLKPRLSSTQSNNIRYMLRSLGRSEAPVNNEEELTDFRFSVYERKGFITPQRRMEEELKNPLFTQNLGPEINISAEMHKASVTNTAHKHENKEENKQNEASELEIGVSLHKSNDSNFSNDNSNNSARGNKLSLFSTVHNPADFPSSLYPIGYSFTPLSPLLRSDMHIERRVQVQQYPSLTPSRTVDWGWKLENQFVEFHSMAEYEQESDYNPENSEINSENETLEQNFDQFAQENAENNEEWSENDSDEDFVAGNQFNINENIANYDLSGLNNEENEETTTFQAYSDIINGGNAQNSGYSYSSLDLAGSTAENGAVELMPLNRNESEDNENDSAPSSSDSDDVSI
jgi:hypothetical protein